MRMPATVAPPKGGREYINELDDRVSVRIEESVRRALVQHAMSNGIDYPSFVRAILRAAAERRLGDLARRMSL